MLSNFPIMSVGFDKNLSADTEFLFKIISEPTAIRTDSKEKKTRLAKSYSFQFSFD